MTSVPDLLVLNDCDIDCAGEPDDLRKKCCSVRELDLAQNKLQNWSEVFTILSNMPRVEFVNLSLNRISGPLQPPMGCELTRLRSLVLNNTHLDWESVERLISRLPSLEELHLSLNDYRNVLIDTVDDDVFYETADFKDELNEQDDENNGNNGNQSNSSTSESICNSCGTQTDKKETKRSKLTFLSCLIQKKILIFVSFQANQYARHTRRQMPTTA